MRNDIPDLPKPKGKDHKADKAAERVSLLTPTLLETLSVAELLDLRSQVEQRLPAKNLKDIDLSRELVLQMLALQQLQQKVLADMETPANQQAQCASAVSAALANLVKVQGDVYTSERLKKIEQSLAEAVNELEPLAAREAFMVTYQKHLGLI